MNLNWQVERMKTFEAVVGFRDIDALLYDRKLGILAQPLLLDGASQLTRVVSGAGLPDLGDAARGGKLDFGGLLELRDSDEAKEFRDWLRRADEYSDDDLRKLVDGLGARIARWVNAPVGRVLRVLVPTMIGACVEPTVGTATGAAFGLLDQFLWDRILPRRGPWSLVGEKFRSLFKE